MNQITASRAAERARLENELAARRISADETIGVVKWAGFTVIMCFLIAYCGELGEALVEILQAISDLQPPPYI